MDDGRETGLSQDDIGSTSSSIGGTFDGDTDIGARESGSVVGAVTSLCNGQLRETVEQKSRRTMATK